MEISRVLHAFWFRLALGVLFALIFPYLASPAIGLAYAIFWIGFDAIFNKD